MDSGDVNSAESANELPEGGVQRRDAAVPGRGDELEELLKSELAPELEVVRRLGRGSMAQVYLARERELKRMVAIKVLSPKLARDERARLRFEREAQAVAGLSHPNIVSVHRVGRLSNDLPYFVMEYVKGRTMEERLQAEGPLPVGEARSAIIEVASALAAAHQKGIVHRDVRPDNVLYESDSGRALLSDFGIVAILASAESGQAARLTRTGELVGDPAHMSPEQLSGHDVTELSDVYALGLMGYELLTGHGPYDVKSRREVITAHMQREPRRLSQLRGDVDPDLEAVLARCLAKEPEHRPRAADVARRLAAPAELTPVPPGKEPQAAEFLANLKERRLPQIIIGYGGFAGVLITWAWTLVESETLPRLVFDLALVAVVTGFPAVLTGAWFHGKKGRQQFEPIEYWVFGGLALIWLVVSAFILVQWRHG